MRAHQFASKIQGAKKVGQEWQGRCPITEAHTHGDSKPSLNWRDSGDKLLVSCKAGIGCSVVDIVARLNLTLSDLFNNPKHSQTVNHGAAPAPASVAPAPPPAPEPTSPSQPDLIYDYRDAAGALLYQVVRRHPKKFIQRRPDPTKPGEFIWNMDSIQRIPFQLDKLQGQKSVVIVEGEKDALRLTAGGLLATCNNEGAKKWTDSHTEMVKAAGVQAVTILGDNDPDGEAHVAMVRASCEKYGLVTCVIHLDGLPAKGDVSDWLDAGHTVDEIRKSIKTMALPASLFYIPGPPSAEIPTTGFTDTFGVYEPDVDGEVTLLPEVKTDITIGAQGIAETTALAWEALTKLNDPPVLYRHGDALVRVARDASSGVPCLRIMNPDRLAHRLCRVANWITPKGGPTQGPTYRILADMLADDEPPLPVLARIATVPTFAPDGRLLDTPGYDAASGVLYMAPKGLHIPSVAVTPPAAQVETARGLVLELLQDFPFTGQADRATAVALLLTTFARGLIQGHVPMVMIEKPTARTGASLLVDCIGHVVLGDYIEKTPEAGSSEEWQKRITATLLLSPPFVVLDNIKSKLDSGALAMAITSGIWRDRVLGVSQMVTLHVQCTWVATANNPTVSNEMAGRIVSCRLDAHVERPGERAVTTFKHHPLLPWVAANRGGLVWACLTLVRHWLAAGAPPGIEVLGGFENWCRVIGGILGAAEIPGLLTNRDDFYARAEEESDNIKGFLVRWWRCYEQEKRPSRDLLEMAVEAQAVEIGKSGEKGAVRSLGRLLRTKLDNRYSLGPDLEVTVRGERDSHDETMVWWLDTRQTRQDNRQPNSIEDKSLPDMPVVAGIKLPFAHETRSPGSQDHGPAEGRFNTRQLPALPASPTLTLSPARSRSADPDDPRNDLEG